MKNTRLAAALFAFLFVILLGLPPQPAQAGVVLGLLNSDLAARMAEFPGSVHLVVADPARNFSYTRGADDLVPSASLYKLWVLLEVEQAFEEGKADPSDILEITDDDISDDGQYTMSGTQLSLQEALERMITLSDNSPALALIRRFGAPAIDRLAIVYGFPHSRLNRWEADDNGLAWNSTTANDVAHFFQALLKGSLVSPARSGAMLEMLSRQQVNDRLPALLPAGTRVAHKTGNLASVVHDAGVIYTPHGPRVVVVLTQDADPEDARALISDLGEISYRKPLDFFSARLGVVTSVTTLPALTAFTVNVTVTNTSSFSWNGASLSGHWLDAAGNVVRWDGLRTSIPVLAPGTSAVVRAHANAPELPGSYFRAWDVVLEGVAWSGDTTAMPVIVTARTPLRTTITTTSSVLSARPGGILLQTFSVASTGTPAVPAPPAPPATRPLVNPPPSANTPQTVATPSPTPLPVVPAPVPALVLSAWWYSANGTAVVKEETGTALTEDSTTRVVNVVTSLTAPTAIGDYWVEWSLQSPGVGWMRGAGFNRQFVSVR